MKGSLLVTPGGFPQEVVNSAFICSYRGDSPNPESMEAFELARPDNLVPGSQRAWVNIVGDLLVPSMDVSDNWSFGLPPDCLPTVPLPPARAWFRGKVRPSGMDWLFQVKHEPPFLLFAI